MEIKKISASEIRDILNSLYVNHIFNIKNYGSITEDLLKIVNKDKKLKWDTKKEITFWYDNINELHLYRKYLEGKKIPTKKGLIEKLIKFKLRKKKNTNVKND